MTRGSSVGLPMHGVGGRLVGGTSGSDVDEQTLNIGGLESDIDDQVDVGSNVGDPVHIVGGQETGSSDGSSVRDPTATVDEPDKKFQNLMIDMGQDLARRLLDMTAKERRPSLAGFCCKHSKTTVEKLGFKISWNEWRKIKIHSRYPGPHKPIIRPKVYR